MKTNTDPLIDLRADGHLAVLTFSVGETGKTTRRFISELTTVLTAGPKKPLIYTTDRSLVAVFKSLTAHVELSNAAGTAFRCSKRLKDGHSLIKFTTDDATVPEGGTWAAGRTPETVYRHELPVFHAEPVYSVLMDLVDSSDDLVDPQSAEELRAEFRAKQPKVPTFEEMVEGNAGSDPGLWDVADPRRTIPGLLAAVKKYRAEHPQGKPGAVSRFFGVGG